MTEREMLELAAKAAGYNVLDVSDDGTDLIITVGGKEMFRNWNPLTDDGDALRLAVHLHMDINFYWDGCDDQYDTVRVGTHGATKDVEEEIGFYISCGQLDESVAVRLCITRAAAEIGRSKHE